MNFSITKKITFSFIILAVLAIAGNSVMAIYTNNIDTSIGLVNDLQKKISIVREIEIVFSTEIKTINNCGANFANNCTSEFADLSSEFKRLISVFSNDIMDLNNLEKEKLNKMILLHNKLISQQGKIKSDKKYAKSLEFSNNIVNLEIQIESLLRGISNSIKIDLDTKMKEANKASKFAILLVLIIISVFAFLAIVLTVFLSNSILSPLRKLFINTKLLSKGEFDECIEITNADLEIQELADSFAQMAKELEKHRLDLIENERMKAIQLMASSVAHEINNPLMIISGTAEYLKYNDFIKKDKDILEKLVSIINETKRISTISKKLSAIKKLVIEDYSMENKNNKNLNESTGIIDLSKTPTK